MTIDLEIFEQVEAFILDEMNAMEHASFVEKLECDNELSKEAEQYKSLIEFLSRKNVDNLTEDIQKVEIELSDEKYFEEIEIKSDDKLMSAIETIGDNELKIELEKTEEEIEAEGYFESSRSKDSKSDKPTIAKWISLSRMFAVAASICVVIGGAIWILNYTDNSKESATAYSEWTNSQVETELISLESIGFANSDKLRDEDFKVALTLLRKCADDQCRLSHLEQHLSNYPSDLAAQYFKGKILVSQQLYDKSLVIWQKLIQERNFKYATDTQWYYSLSLFQSEGCNLKVKGLLKGIIHSDDNPYSYKARDLIKSKKCLK